MIESGFISATTTRYAARHGVFEWDKTNAGGILDAGSGAGVAAHWTRNSRGLLANVKTYAAD